MHTLYLRNLVAIVPQTSGDVSRYHVRDDSALDNLPPSD
ncbi:hypothetical protein KCQ_18517 [Pectobacterium atrosepticum ICMP 1526]|nr:hypothetical protein KCQ_18517 [Pectobacterium atrosepticum ICMP 1526]